MARTTNDTNDAKALHEAIRDNLSPEAVVAIAAHLVAASTARPDVNGEIAWLAKELIGLVGIDEYNRLLCERLGL